MFFQKPGYNYAGLVGFPCRVFQPPYKLGKSFMTTHHYVYHSYEEWGREYIGCRSCDCLPEEDIKYFGSFKDKTFKPTGKTILFTGETREEVAEIEIKLHDFFDVAVNPQFANQAKQTSTRFDMTGVVRGSMAEEHKKKLREALSGEKHPMYGVPHTEEWKQALSERRFGENNPMFGRTGASHPNSKAIIAIEPDGTQRHYGSGCEAAKELGIYQGNFCRYLKPGHVLTRGPFKGWKFVYDLTPVYEN